MTTKLEVSHLQAEPSVNKATLIRFHFEHEQKFMFCFLFWTIISHNRIELREKKCTIWEPRIGCSHKRIDIKRNENVRCNFWILYANFVCTRQSINFKACTDALSFVCETNTCKHRVKENESYFHLNKQNINSKSKMSLTKMETLQRFLWHQFNFRLPSKRNIDKSIFDSTHNKHF